MATLFISDLHLSEQRPKIITLFLDFLNTRASKSEALYILGDLFEYWIGDEVGNLPQTQPVIQGLKQLTDAGVPVFIMHGNRDFLLGSKFEKATGCQIIDDPSIVNLNNTRTLLMHGDTLCTDDKDYLKFRSIVRNPDWQAEFLGKSIDERIAMANEYREMSKNAMDGKSPEIMDANQDAIAGEMLKNDTLLLIHGHTHRPGKHQFELNGKSATRIVLGDWYEQGSILSCDESGCDLESIQ
jgi:UDP-2,3-diacylglucosamine hydrolase